MVTPINIDISDFIGTWSLTLQEQELFVSNILDEVSSRFAESWYNEAGKVLKRTKKEYQQSIYIEKINQETVLVGLRGWLPNAIEKGMESFDMKEEFKTSSKRKFKKDGGWYLTIPFRIGTPDIVGESAIFSKIMPNEIYKVARKELKSSGTKLTFEKLPKEFQITNIRPEVVNKATNKVFEQYKHKNPIFEGMQKSQKEGHGHYITFRRVSDLSDENSWIHSGLIARNLMSKTLQSFNLPNIISQVKQNFIDVYR